MNTPAFLKTTCYKCRGHIEYPPEGAGERIPCPHCGAEVALPAPAREHLLIQTKATPIHVKESALTSVLQVIGAFQLITAPFIALLSSGGSAEQFAIMIAAGIATLSFAKLIESTHQTAQRLARLEVYFQTVVNERL